MFEALCERDLRIYADVNDGVLYHYQDYSGKEIDAVIELPDGEWLAIEIKLGANQIDAAAENLISISNAIKSEKWQSTESIMRRMRPVKRRLQAPRRRIHRPNHRPERLKDRPNKKHRRNITPGGIFIYQIL